MTTATALDFGPATHLTCRACGEQYPLGAAYACMECFGPLEVGYEFVAPTREDIEPRDRRTSGATARCCRSRRTSPSCPA